MNHFKIRVRNWIVPAVLTLSIFILLRFVFLVGYVPTESMEPTIKAGSFILGTRINSSFERGDIIVFCHDDQLLVKRIAACPGDQIDLRELTYMKTVAMPVWENPILTVPDGCYFVLGDNTDNSIDSRYWADPFVRENEIIAKVKIYQNLYDCCYRTFPGEDVSQGKVQ